MKIMLNKRQKMEKIYELYEQKMFMTAYAILQDYQQAEDAVQEACIKLAKHLDKLSDITSSKSRKYIFLMTKDISIDMYRKNQINNNHSFSVEEEKLEAFSPAISINETLQVENEIYIQNLLNKLPISYKEVIQDYYYKQLSIAEIAISLQISEAAARKRLQRAIATLKNMIGDENYEYKII